VTSIVGLIPARSGSERVKDKNIRPLDGHPLLAYAIVSALESGIFERVVVSTNSDQYAEIAQHYGAETDMRSEEFSGASSPDFDWLNDYLSRNQDYGAFAILRPTSPFRTAETIRRAWAQFEFREDTDSLRAVEKATQHPAKMWVLRSGLMVPLIPFGPTHPPWHSSPYDTLPVVYAQNASLEMAWTKTVLHKRSIAGETIMPFLTVEPEGVDINYEWDWSMAESMTDKLPHIDKEAWRTDTVAELEATVAPHEAR
jgi:N-acylneuraminate cytidylyltransferase